MNSNLEEEIWKEIQEFEGLYAVSNKGRVKNLMSGKVLKNKIDGAGYLAVGLKGKNYNIHRLMAQAFIPNTDNLPQVNHKDENKLNNDISNLEWVSASKNVRHSIHQQSCRINQLTLDGKFIRQWESSHEIERELGFANNNIIQSCKGNKNYSHVGGYKWEYADPSQQHKFNRPVAALTKDGEFIAEYKNAAEAARCLKICSQLIYQCLKGTYKSSHGLKFFYLD